MTRVRTPTELAEDDLGRGWWHALSIPSQKLHPIKIGEIYVTTDYRIDYNEHRILIETRLFDHDECSTYFQWYDFTREDYLELISSDDIDAIMVAMLYNFADKLYSFVHELHIIRGEN